LNVSDEAIRVLNLGRFQKLRSRTEGLNLVAERANK
jgi:hypothetical protein